MRELSREELRRIIGGKSWVNNICKRIKLCQRYSKTKN